MSNLPLPVIPRACTPALTLAIAVASIAAPVLAQDCRGLPSQRLHVMASRLELNDGTPSYTGELGLHAGRAFGGNLNYNTADIGTPGSVTRSAGFRVYRQRQGRLFSVCVITGLQLGQIHLIDVDATSYNYRETSTTVPLAAPISARRRLAPGVRVTGWIAPQYLLQRSEGQLYDRADTLRIDESPSSYATEVGATLALTRLFVRLSWFKRADRDADITLGGGFAW